MSLDNLENIYSTTKSLCGHGGNVALFFGYMCALLSLGFGLWVGFDNAFIWVTLLVG